MASLVAIVLLLFVGGLCGFFLGRNAAKEASEGTVSEDTVILSRPEIAELAAEATPIEEAPETGAEILDLAEYAYFDVPLSENLQRHIFELCAENNVPVALVFAIIECESNFNPEVISKTDDYGLMQINVVNHGWAAEQFKCTDMLNPYQNVYIGIHMIGEYLEKYGNVERALLAYALGEGGAAEAWAEGRTTTHATRKFLNAMPGYEISK